MSLIELVSLVHPPSQPIGSGSPEAWFAVEDRLGTRLPGDYKEYIDTYGGGEILEFACIASPLEPNPRSSWFGELFATLQYYRDEGDTLGIGIPAFPERGGLLPWGWDHNGNNFYWKTSGEPTDWTVVVVFERFGGYSAVPLPMTEFLSGVITGRVPADWSCNFDPDNAVFVQY